MSKLGGIAFVGDRIQKNKKLSLILIFPKTKSLTHLP